MSGARTARTQVQARGLAATEPAVGLVMGLTREQKESEATKR